MPTFSVSAVVNNFIVRRPSVTRRQQQNASARSTTPHPEETSASPPRPARGDLCNAVGREERVHPLLSPGLVNFYNIGPPLLAWTSQEKEDKWDDLLEKSAQAGGTLHLDTESVGLPSDNLRFSSGTLESEVLSS
ncbi:hypothetical protein EDB85DRAFT_2160542 [Lactarius pseudohatsudake]|nr:hypothetical protein EDB85DRAFT_2160542 [Lactarius pseudohatsudake]